MIAKNQLIWMEFIWLIAASFVFIPDSLGQVHIQAIYFFKYLPTADSSRMRAKLVEGLDSADYFRVVTPPSDGNKRYNIQEYYKTGKIKLIGRTLPSDTLFDDETYAKLDGPCATYYPNGVKESIANYWAGNKIGNEYLFYPNGKLYCYLKNNLSDLRQFVECYDKKGNALCINGDGQWIVYDLHYDNIITRGAVKKGHQNGEWHGRTLRSDSIKFSYFYDDGDLKKTIGYDNAGISYPFNYTWNGPTYAGQPVWSFYDVLTDKIKWPRDGNGKKIPIDTVNIYFIVEKDGSVNNYQILHQSNINIKEAFLSATRKCHAWKPGKFYGVITRTAVSILVTINKSGHQSMDYTEIPVSN
ncbi:MAG: toxin-antitoxin system YwqK family antitoxin [Mucilaginibacter sp.]